jgi:hypothetical protein
MSKKQKKKKQAKAGLKKKTSIKRTHIPVQIFIQEAIDLHAWCQADRELLVRAGLDWNLVETLPQRAGKLRQSHSEWLAVYRNPLPCELEWKELLPQVKNLRTELLHHFSFAYQANDNAKNALAQITRANTIRAILQDLASLAELGSSFPEELRAINMDSSLLDEARAYVAKLTRLTAEVAGAKREPQLKINQRNECYFQLKTSLDEIKKVARYALWKNKSRLAGYRSNYRLATNEAYKKRKKEQNSLIAPQEP